MPGAGIAEDKTITELGDHAGNGSGAGAMAQPDFLNLHLIDHGDGFFDPLIGFRYQMRAADDRMDSLLTADLLRMPQGVYNAPMGTTEKNDQSF